MRLVSKIALAAALCTLLIGQDEPATFRTDIRLVALHATVVDRNGRLVTNLPRSAFKVFENGAPQEIKQFTREDVPVSMGLVFDNSGSMKPHRQQVEQAAVALVKASNPDDEVFVVNFNDSAFLDVDFTNDIKKLEEGVRQIDQRGGTAMRDALSLSIDYVKQKGKRDKKVLLVVTDGNDVASSITLEKLVQKAQQSEVLIYAMGLMNDEDRRERRRGERALKEITTASGGTTYYAKDSGDVQKLALEMAHEIRNQYIITYTPSNSALDGSFRQIKVTAEGPNRPQVRTRTGYYATPQPTQSRGPEPKSVKR
jgi:VWFA-related protein